VGSHFVAITDPGSKMEQVAKATASATSLWRSARSAGATRRSRISAWLPATVAGLKVGKLLDEAAKGSGQRERADQEQSRRAARVAAGNGANAGRDKITFFTSPEIHDLGAWLEQLIAESTGKQGKGITPVDREAIGAARGVRQRPRLCLRAPEERQRTRARNRIWTPRLRLWRLPAIRW
jgi:glucose-6-phosphate isomerase